MLGAIRPAERALEEEEIKELIKTLLEVLDEDEECEMNFGQFSTWLKKTYIVLAEAKPQAKSTNNNNNSSGPTSQEGKDKIMAEKVRKKFDQMDWNGNGMLEGEELLALADWVFASFNPGKEVRDQSSLPPLHLQCGLQCCYMSLCYMSPCVTPASLLLYLTAICRVCQPISVKQRRQSCSGGWI